MKDFKKYTDEDLTFFFQRGLSTTRRYHRIDTKEAFSELAVKRPKAFRAIFCKLEHWRQSELIESYQDDVANMLIKKYKQEVK